MFFVDFNGEIFLGRYENLLAPRLPRPDGRSRLWPRSRAASDTANLVVLAQQCSPWEMAHRNRWFTTINGDLTTI